jgi:hypothetical protein
MTRKENTMTTNTIDWNAAVKLATVLGRRTLELVALRDADQAREWALQMASAHGSSAAGNAPRAASYLELAVLLGYEPPPEPEPVKEAKTDE